MKYPVLLINLDRQPDRLKFMLAQLSGLGVEPDRVQAVDGKNKSMMASCAAAPYSNLTLSEKACFESHRKVWKKIVDENHEGAFVLEDDTVVSSDLFNLDFEKAIGENYDIVKIDQATGPSMAYGTKATTVGKDRSVVRMVGTEISTGCYFISNKAARYLLKNTTNYILAVDVMMFNVESRLFWNMRVGKLVKAGAIQLHMLFGIGNLSADFKDRIQQGLVENIPFSQVVATKIRDLLVKSHRLLTFDVRRVRNARTRKNRDIFAASEKIVTNEVLFESSSDAHYANITKEFNS